MNKAAIAQEDTTEAHHVKMVHPVLATLEEQFVALLFGHGSINVAFNKARVLGHICQLPKDLVSTYLAQKWLGEITVAKTSAAHCQCRTQGIVATLPLINGVTRQVGCPFTLIVCGNHSVWRRCMNTATHAMASNATQKCQLWWPILSIWGNHR